MSGFRTDFPEDAVIARMTARMLLEVRAVDFNAERPFVLTSGWHSPVYINCRKLIFYPRLRNTLMDFATSIVLQRIGFEQIEIVTGGESAGIPFAAWMADRLMLPMQFVRKRSKGFGRHSRIEGEVTQGARTLLVEDVTTDGRSKASFCAALRGAGAKVEHTFVLFNYDIFPETRRLLSEMGLQLHSLATWRDVIAEARAGSYFEPATLAEVERFLDDPGTWSAAHGGIARYPD